MLVDDPVHIPPDAGDADVSLIHEPAVTNTVATGPCGVNDQWGEALHPPVDIHVINLDATFGKEFSHVAVGQAVAQVPAHRQQDHILREPVTDERRGHSKATTNHPGTLRLTPIHQRNSARVTPGGTVALSDRLWSGR